MDEERYKSFIEHVLSEGDVVMGSRTYKPWQQEVIDECNQLTDRIVKLAGFMLKDSVYATWLAEEQNSLKQQLLMMRSYRMILKERIARFA